MSPQYGKLRPTNGWDLLASLGLPSKFQWVLRFAFVTAAMSLTRGQPNFERCLAISWVGTLYIRFRGCCPWRNFACCRIHFTSKSCIFLYWQHYCTALEQWASAKLCGVIQGMELGNFCRGCDLYLAGWPSRWALIHILVLIVILCVGFTVVSASLHGIFTPLNNHCLSLVC